MLKLIIGLLTASILFGVFSLVTKLKTKLTRKNSATVLVIGDIGRSPRMMYHAESLAKKGWETVIIGYNDTPPIPSLTSIPHVHIYPIASPPKFVNILPWIARAPLRVVFQILSIFYITCFEVPIFTELLIVQNPPSIPTLPLAQLISRISGCKLIIDWHNEGHSILALRLGSQHILVRVAQWFEMTFGKIAYAHLFVTKSLEDHLTRSWGLKGKQMVLYDRPPNHFRNTDTMSLHELFHRLSPQLSPPIPATWLRDEKNGTMLSKPNNGDGMPMLRSDRPALIVSSTSWTADEDFSLLITALDQYQDQKRSSPALPKLLVIITGKGALRKPFEMEVAKRERDGKIWKDILVRCVFLEARDYPVLLGCADLGISLHTSSSGRDLPMKVVDMFGCRVPVLAKGFPCIGELVKDGKNGLIFETGGELGTQIADTLSEFPSSKKLNMLKSYFNVPDRPSSRASHRRGSTDLGEDEWTNWDENWDRAFYQGVLGRTGFVGD